MARMDGVLWRGARRRGDEATLTLDMRAFDASTRGLVGPCVVTESGARVGLEAERVLHEAEVEKGARPGPGWPCRD